MKSFAILRTNVGLTTNVKIVVESDYSLSLDSIDSNDDLSIDRYKKVSFNKKNYYDELIPYFYKDLPAEKAYQIRYRNDVDEMTDDFSYQYDELYNYGARNIVNNKNYKEEFEYFAPLYINRKLLPKNFVVFRVDGPGIDILSKDSFKSNILNKLKIVKLYDLTPLTPLGEWLDINFKSNQYFPESPLEIDFRSLEFSKWNGIDYKTGGYTSKSFFIDDIIDEEKELFEFDKFVFNNYRENQIVFPNILNFSFLFDDEPATPETKRKWSINRYYGFYLDDMELVKTISPYITPFLKDDVSIIEGNILYSPTGDPFIEGWSSNRPFYVEYNGNYYPVEQFKESQGVSIQQVQGPNGEILEQYQEVVAVKYRIISDLDLEDKESELNKNTGLIDENNKLINYDITNFTIDEFDSADVWIIEINGIYHNLIKDTDGSIKVYTDYSFKFNENDYEYKVAGQITKVSFVVDFNNPPKKFNIYKLKFSDIKDFDTRIVDTEYSKYEYEKEEDITITDEGKFYLENLNSNSNPKDLDDFVYKNEVVNIPVSSEYTANYETFKINNGELTDLWRVNPVYCRWSYQNSLSANDYPYLLNNSFLFEDFNRSVNPFEQNPIRSERNLDYFYTINSSTSSYLHHSLHIEKLDVNGDIDDTFRFELDKYLNIGTYSIGTSSATYSFDYFTYFFDNSYHFNNSTIKKNVKKYSQFNIGDDTIPNITLFRGIEFRLYDVESVILNSSNEIENINIKSSNQFEDYKFSILLSDNEYSVNNNGELVNSSNGMSWTIIDKWEMDKVYSTGSIVLFDDILYQTNTEIITESPARFILSREVRTAPYNEGWSYYTIPGPTLSIFWSPTSSYTEQVDIIYNNNEYYYCYSTASGVEDIWNPIIAESSGYNLGDVVLYKGNYYMSMTSSNSYNPNQRRPFRISLFDNNFRYWVATQSSNPKWKPIQLWNPSDTYAQNEFVVHNDTVWIGLTDSEAGFEPGIETSIWGRKYSLEPDTNYLYPGDNSIIFMNNKYYLCNNNTTNSTLDNGIVIYINKKWKNVLVNINIADNTFDKLSETNRDDIYEDLYRKLTAYNFILSVNDIVNKYDFTDYISYVIIDENGNISKYNYKNNISALPHLLKCEYPDDFDVKVESLTKTAVPISNLLNPKKYLNDGKIENITQLNYYNNIPIASVIEENKYPAKVFENYHGNTNIVANKLYRFTGYYMPLFYDIQLFKKSNGYENTENYIFDTTLTEFGLIKERVIRKVNMNGSVLKLKNNADTNSIYPMIDEFGYTVTDFFIFKSTWDYEYHLQTIENNNNTTPNIIQISIPTTSTSVGQPPLVQNQNYTL